MDDNHLESLLNEAFDTTDLYQIIGVEKTADISLIKQSYRKLALKYHPDRVNGDSKKFQALSAAHSILSDEDKRKIYDETGDLNDSDELNGKDFDAWYEYFRNLYPAITTKSIDDFATKYHGSEEEKQDIITLYERFHGDLFMMFNYIMCSDDEESEERICQIIDAYITNANNNHETINEYPKYKKLKSKFLANKTKRIQSHKQENTKTKKSKTSSSKILSLEQQIMQNRNKNVSSMASIFSKYGGGNFEDDDISEEAFLATQEKIVNKKKSKK